MTITPRKRSKQTKRRPVSLLFERGMALLASVNLVFVAFDLSYIPLRNFWLQGRVQFYARIARYEWKFPAEPVRILPVNITLAYDWVKGIEPYRDTAYYLQRVEDLLANRQQIDSLTPSLLEANEAEIDTISTELNRLNTEQEAILAELRTLSVEMVDTNPFEIANKTGTLEKIKNRMRRHIFDDTNASARESFQQFWSSEYLTENDWREEINFYEREIKPLLETNYFRPIGENGRYVDNFGLLDFPFFLIFLLEFLARSWYISRRHTGVSWFDAMLWRWYDIFFLIPLLRWLRVLPVVIRLNQADLIDLSAIQKQASQGFVASIAEDITEIVFIRIINQIQGSIHRGEFANLLSQTIDRQYIDINDTNETVELVKLIANLFTHQVLPQIQPAAEALIKHTIEEVISLSPAYQNFQVLPGMADLKALLATQISHQIYQITTDILKTIVEEDPIYDELFDALVAQFTRTMTTEMQAKESLERMESLLSDLLEEIKINYIQRLSEEDVEEILEQTRTLRQIVH